MNTKHTASLIAGIIAVVMASVSYETQAQILIMSANQQLIGESVKGGMAVIRQTYQLEDTVSGQRFGRYGNDEFGFASALAIRTPEGYITSADIMTPWESDVNFDKYRETHKPVMSNAFIIELGDSATTDTLRKDSFRYEPFQSLAVLCTADTLMPGFETKVYHGRVDGWCVWVADDSLTSEYSGERTPYFNIKKQTVDFSQNPDSIVIDVPNITKIIWGGIFIVPKHTGIGRMTFCLAGIMARNPDNDGWNVLIPEFTPPGQTAEEGNELTPLSVPTIPLDNKKNKK